MALAERLKTWSSFREEGSGEAGCTHHTSNWSRRLRTSSHLSLLAAVEGHSPPPLQQRGWTLPAGGWPVTREAEEQRPASGTLPPFRLPSWLLLLLLLLLPWLLLRCLSQAVRLLMETSRLCAPHRTSCR